MLEINTLTDLNEHAEDVAIEVILSHLKINEPSYTVDQAIRTVVALSPKFDFESATTVDDMITIYQKFEHIVEKTVKQNPKIQQIAHQKHKNQKAEEKQRNTLSWE